MKFLYIFIAVLIFNSSVFAQECNNDCNSCSKTSSIQTVSSEDEFETFDAATDTKQEVVKIDNNINQQNSSNWLDRKEAVPLIGLGLTLISGILLRFSKTRKLRPIILVGSIAFFGFYNSACPCPISSFHDTVLSVAGLQFHWENAIWFLGLLPLTYIFGKTWCGWVCHLGGLQELLYKYDKIKIFKTAKFQAGLRIFRIIFFVALLAQIIIMQTNLYCIYDPFKAIFNLSTPNSIVWILVLLLVLSSIFVYRPFCKTVCPIAVMLGAVSKIKGAYNLKFDDNCRSCKKGINSCSNNSLEIENNKYKLVKFDCINCGDCYDTCVDKCSIK